MAKFLRDLLDASEPAFSQAIRELEHASGRTAVDSRLVGDISARVRLGIEHLGLDAHDVTGRELYAALLARVANDNSRLARIIGGDNPDNLAQMLPLAIRAVDRLKIDRSCWALKRSVARQKLRQLPPLRLMKLLGYRSVDAMLKHENIDELYIGMRLAESEDWLKQYNQTLATVGPGDFEDREIRAFLLPYDKYVSLVGEFVAKKLHNVAHAKEMGLVAVLPLDATASRGVTVQVLAKLLHYINEIHVYGSFFKFKQMGGDFGQVMADTLNNDLPDASQMASWQVHWRLVHRHFANGTSRHPDVFGPYIHPGDLWTGSVYDLLAQIDPAMKFWAGADYVAKLYDDLPVSFSLMDVSACYVGQIPYERRYFYHFRESLWNEIFLRYMGQANLESQVLSQLDSKMTTLEELTV